MWLDKEESNSFGMDASPDPVNQTVDYGMYTIETHEDEIEEHHDDFYNDIKISGTTWGEIKDRALEPGYLDKSAFVKYLKKTEKELLKKLIKG